VTSAEAAARRLGLPPRDDRPRARLGRNVKTDSLGRPLAEGDRSPTPTSIVWTLRLLSEEGAAACLYKVGRPLGPSEFPHFHAPRRVLLPEARGALFKVPTCFRRAGGAGELRALAGESRLQSVGLRFGDTIVIQGAGGLGIQAAAVAKGHGRVRRDRRGSDRRTPRAGEGFGADHTINIKEIPERKERVSLVRKLTEGAGADIVCDFVGFPQVIAEGIDMLRQGGTYLEIGTISRGAKVEFEPASLVWGAKRIVGVIMYDSWVIPRALDFSCATHALAVRSLISHKYPLEKIDEAFAQSEWHAKDTTRITRAALTP